MKTKTVVNLINEVNQKCASCFPINNSLIPLFILNKTMDYHLNEKILSLKNLYSEISSSELGARNHITRLERKEWLSIEKSLIDTRVKVIKPTKKLIDTYEQLTDGFVPLGLVLCNQCPHYPKEV